MLINDKLRDLAKRRKLRKLFEEMYIQKKMLNSHLPIWQDKTSYLSLSPRGFCYHGNEEKNMKVKYQGGLLKHIPFIGNVLFYTSPCHSEIFAMNIPCAKEITYLFKNYDIDGLKRNFNYGFRQHCKTEYLEKKLE